MDLPYYLAFSHCLGIGPVRFRALSQHFGSAEKAYLANPSEIEKIVGKTLTDKFVDFRNKFNIEQKMSELQKNNVQIITQDNPAYPESLKNIPDPPICLYAKGNFNNFPPVGGFFMAVVGTRKPTPYGEQMTKKFASGLTEAGFTVVSGMAMGIDALAHWACLSQKGRTIAVLGCGVNIIYPAVNTMLYHKIIEQNGVVISEFPPDQTVLKGLFIARNRIISGLSLGVLIVEGAKDSGALITARYAAEQGKEVFAVPAPLTSEMSAAPNILIKQGAKLVMSVDDIIEEFGLKLTPKKKENIILQLNDDEKNIFAIINKEPCLIDEIISTSRMKVEKVMHIISLLEIKGAIEKNSEGEYQIC